MNLGFYMLIFRFTPQIGTRHGLDRISVFHVSSRRCCSSTAWSRPFFMPNVDEFSELVRTGDLDFALLKPIDTQFLVSLAKVDWSALSNFVFAACVLVICAGAHRLPAQPGRGRALSAVHRVRRGDFIQPDDRPGGHERLAGPESNAVRLLVLHHEFLALSDGDLRRADGHAAAVRASRSSFRCWWW